MFHIKREPVDSTTTTATNSTSTAQPLATPVATPVGHIAEIFAHLQQVDAELAQLRETNATLQAESQRSAQFYEAQLAELREENRQLKLANNSLNAIRSQSISPAEQAEVNELNQSTTELNTSTTLAPVQINFDFFSNAQNSLDTILTCLKRTDIPTLPIDPECNKNVLHALSATGRKYTNADYRKLCEVVNLIVRKDPTLLTGTTAQTHGLLTPLLYAILKQNVFMAIALLNCNPNLATVNVAGNNAIAMACTIQDMQNLPSSTIIVNILEKCHPNQIMARNGSGKNALELLSALSNLDAKRYESAVDLMRKKLSGIPHDPRLLSGKRSRTSEAPAPQATNHDDDNDNAMPVDGGVSATPRR